MLVYTKRHGSSAATSYGVILLVLGQNEIYFNSLIKVDTHVTSSVLTIYTIVFS